MYSDVYYIHKTIYQIGLYSDVYYIHVHKTSHQKDGVEGSTASPGQTDRRLQRHNLINKKQNLLSNNSFSFKFYFQKNKIK